MSQEAVKNNQRAHRKIKRGVVVSNKMDKTVVVEVERTIRHPLYHKIVSRSKKYYVHDETNSASIGDTVEIMETRPLSKLKRFRVVSVEPKIKA